MASLLELVTKLKKDLYQASDSDYMKEKYITAEEIHKIRRAITKIVNEKIDKEKYKFIEQYYDFKSIYEYFFHNPEQGFNQYYSINDYTNSLLDPLCIYLMDNDYEVNIKKIKIEENVVIFHSNILDYINSMDVAYNESDYKRLTTLSSSVLQCVFKEICERTGEPYNNSDKFPILFKKVRNNLKLNAELYSDNPELREFCSKLNNLILLVNEIRNLYSDSHGQSNNGLFNYDKLPKHHFKLILDTTKTITNFLVDSYEHQYRTLTL